MTTVGALIASLTPAAIRRSFVTDPAAPVAGIRIHEPGRAPGEAQLVLAVGVDRASDLAALVRSLGAGPAGLVAKCRDEDADEVATAAATAGLAVLVVDDDADWLSVMALLQAAIADGTPPAPVQDLFELADLAARTVGGPVTIEDEAGNVIAYSRDQEGGDDVRVRTLIARRSPADFSRALAARGIPQLLARSTEPVPVTGIRPGVADRVAVALRAGTFPLGSIWVLAAHPTTEQLSALTGVAAHVSLQLMKRRSEGETARRIELEHLAVLLHGGTGLTGPAPLAAGTHWVAALDIAEVDTAARALIRARVEQRLALVPRGEGFTFVAGQMSNLLYLIVTGTAATPDDRPPADGVQRWLTDLLRDRGDGTLLAVHTGIGRAALAVNELPRSRREAEQALAVARAEPRPAGPVSFDQCWARASLGRALDAALLADLDNLTPLWRLRDHDTRHGTDYVPTLAAWLRWQGGIREAAAELHIHANTLRYRLEKLTAVAGVDLDDPDARLILALQLWPTRRRP